MSDPNDFGNIDAYFEALAKEKKISPSANKAGEIPTLKDEKVRAKLDKVLASRIETPLLWDSTENDGYPGGANALRKKYEGSILHAFSICEKEFGLSKKHPLKIIWIRDGDETPEGASAQFSQSIDIYIKNDTEVTFRTLASKCEALKLYGDPADHEPMINHEFGHITFYNSLPDFHSLQEAAACVTQAILDRKRGLTYENLLMPQVLEGQSGWSVPEFGNISYSHDAGLISYAAFFHSFIELCNGDLETAKDVLIHAKNRWDLNDRVGQERYEMPLMRDWIREAESKFQGFTSRFVNSSLFANIPSGDRLIWTPHKDWGGILCRQNFKENPNFLKNIYEPTLDQTYGHLTTPPSCYCIRFPEEETMATVRINGNFKVTPQNISDIFKVAGERKKIPYGTPKNGTTIQIDCKEGKSESEIVLTWNEVAEKMLLMG